MLPQPGRGRDGRIKCLLLPPATVWLCCVLLGQALRLQRRIIDIMRATLFPPAHGQTQTPVAPPTPPPPEPSATTAAPGSPGASPAGSPSLWPGIDQWVILVALVVAVLVGLLVRGLARRHRDR